MKDWLGGLPFEVARPSKVIELARNKMNHIKMLGINYCNEYVFKRSFISTIMIK